MAKIPSARTEIAAMYASCPHCNEDFQDTDDGSMLLSMHNLKPEQIGQVVTCWACENQYRLPASLKKVFR